MNSVLVECWNCGQKLKIRADKLALARCGNCQQMVAKEDRPESKIEYQQRTEYQPITKSAQTGGMMQGFFAEIFSGVFGFIAEIVVNVCVWGFFIAITKGDILVGTVLWVMFGSALHGILRWLRKSWRKAREAQQR